MMFRFPASLAATVGACDLDSTDHIHLPQTLDLSLVLQRHGAEEKPFWQWLKLPVDKDNSGSGGTSLP